MTSSVISLARGRGLITIGYASIGMINIFAIYLFLGSKWPHWAFPWKCSEVCARGNVYIVHVGTWKLSKNRKIDVDWKCSVCFKTNNGLIFRKLILWLKFPNGGARFLSYFSSDWSLPTGYQVYMAALIGYYLTWRSHVTYRYCGTSVTDNSNMHESLRTKILRIELLLCSELVRLADFTTSCRQ